MKENIDRKDFLDEANHRIKNNLQLVNSLLKIQARNYPDLTVEEFHKKSQNRIITITLIHENLYYDSNVINKLHMSNYINALLNFLIEDYGYNIKKLKLNIDVSNILLDIKTGIPIGLIINELILNSITHAFKNETYEDNEITLTIKKTRNKFTLTYKDNGIGFNENLITKSLGLEIISLLTQQLNGNLKYTTNNGVDYRIIFEENF